MQEPGLKVRLRSTCRVAVVFTIQLSQVCAAGTRALQSKWAQGFGETEQCDVDASCGCSLSVVCWKSLVLILCQKPYPYGNQRRGRGAGSKGRHTYPNNVILLIKIWSRSLVWKIEQASVQLSVFSSNISVRMVYKHGPAIVYKHGPAIVHKHGPVSGGLQTWPIQRLHIRYQCQERL